ncbi:S8 family peptidase [Flavobacterium sp. SM2513]|uniref:S8 family peptidase n=1 Tax=Flavobacterium sp. SM2513 TaxID=3424766 RepID=UPI003D7FE07B
MKKIKLTYLSLALALALTGCSTTKVVMYNVDTLPVKKEKITDDQLQRWSHLDIITDTIPGMSVDKAYAELLKDKKGTKVIVGIIDSGVDIEHPDLVNAIWTNPKEIAGNGIDDDNNGYIDDIHGWNFLGDITKENLEYERIVKDKTLTDEATYKKAKALYDEKMSEATQGRGQLESMTMAIDEADEVIQKELKKEVYTVEDLEAITSTDATIVQSKAVMKKMLSFGLPVVDLKVEIKKELEGALLVLNGDNLKTNYRKVLGDNPNDLTDTKYGNNNVIGPDKDEALHGTHVAGIVAQGRYNNIGGDGVASNNVEILTVRAVPDGDEYDKDIALAIRYAVDNGAKVINGSFGKSFSPQKQWVYDAIKYAEKKDVLIVHAAGNDAKDIDIEDNFPNDSDDKKTEFADNLITIGALNFEYGENVVANFSNFGALNVDVFAPGVQIYATTPENTYRYLAGTSMASPNVAGVAALIRSYYPKLSASQVKHILMNSGTKLNSMVQVGGRNGEKKQFSTLSKSGRIVNAYSALQMAAKMSGQ